MSIIAEVLSAFVLPPVSSWGWALILRRWVKPQVLAGWFSAAGFGTGYGVFQPDWPWAAGSAASLAVVIAVWWWRRRKRRQVLARLGAKSRALRDALVDAMRRERKPSRVLRPHPAPS